MLNRSGPMHPRPPVPAVPLYSVPRRLNAADAPQRLQALDAFRGITIAAMILVNNPGDWQNTYAALQHAEWNGWTPADLIFPFFLFIVGVAITFSVVRSLEQGDPRRVLAGKILRRTVTIFALGIILNGFPLFDWSTLRVPGILQRVALCYGMAAGITLVAGVRGQLLTFALLVCGYWAVMVGVPGRGGEPFGPETNIAALIDVRLLSGHLLHSTWDPEGLLGTLPALATTLAGVVAGAWLRSGRGAWERVVGLFVAGNLGLAVGAVMNVWCPINKSLWSSSYVVFTAGMALNFLAVCYWLIDCKGYRRWAKPFVIYGTNPIVAYELSSLMTKVMLLGKVTTSAGARVDWQQYLLTHVFLPFAAPRMASLLYALTYVVLWLGISAVLYRHRIVIKM